MPQKKILIVDDEKAIAEIFRLQLEGAGYQVSTALSTDRGLELFRFENPDLVLLDALMPGKDGFAFLKEIEGPDGAPKAPVLIMSGNEDLRVTFGELKVSGFLEKPFSFATALAEIRKIIGN